MHKHPLIERDEYQLSCHLNNEGDLFVHVDVDEWSKRIYQQMLEDWIEVLQGLKSKGVNKVFSYVPKEQEKAMKLTAMFGLMPIGEREGNILFEIET